MNYYPNTYKKSDLTLNNVKKLIRQKEALQQQEGILEIVTRLWK